MAHPRGFDVLVTASTFPASSEDSVLRYALEISKALQRQAGFRVLAVAPHGPNTAARERLEGVEVRRFRYAFPARLERLSAGSILASIRRRRRHALLVPGFLAGQLAQVLALVARERPRAIVASWLVPQGLLGALVKAVFPEVKLVVVALGQDAALVSGSAAGKRVARFIARRADHLVAVSRFLGDTVAQAAGLALGSIEVIPTGVDLDPLVRARAGVTKAADFELAFLGRVEEKKGVEFLLQAIPEILAAVPSARLNVFGDGTLRERLEARAQALGLGERVCFHGQISGRRIPSVLARQRCLVVPSVNLRGDVEGLPTVILEAAALGVPVVATDAGGNRDFVDDGETGLLVPQRDPAALARAVIRLAQSPALIQRLTDAAEARVRAGFTYDAVAVRLARLIDPAIDTAAPLGKVAAP